MAGLFLLNPPTSAGRIKMAKTRSRRRHGRRHARVGSRRRLAALKGWRRRKAARHAAPVRRRSRRRRMAARVVAAPRKRRRRSRGRRRNPLYRRSHSTRSHRGGTFAGRRHRGWPRIDQLFWRLRKRRYGKSGRRRGKRRSAASRRASRRRNPNGFLGDLLSVPTWMSAAGLGAGILGSRILANQVQRFLPALPAAAEPFVGPLITAASGIGLGMVANFLPIRGKAALSKNLMIGGFVAAALPILENLGRSVGLLSDYVQLQGYRDYVQLQGLGTQAQVEAGQFSGLGTQAQVEAGQFSGSFPGSF
jgi:hypothetical protein